MSIEDIDAPPQQIKHAQKCKIAYYCKCKANSIKNKQGRFGHEGECRQSR
ncbi:MAG: hypothetical protein ACI94Z_002101 [Yoonia sp.]|jgi:hypothetical protein